MDESTGQGQLESGIRYNWVERTSDLEGWDVGDGRVLDSAVREA